MSVRTRTIILVVAMLGIPAGLFAAADPLLGTWKQIAPPGKNVTRTHTLIPGGVRVHRTGAEEDGTPVNAEIDIKFDGKFYAYKGDEYVDTMNLKRISQNSFEGTVMKGGTVTAHYRWDISNDGKVFTWVVKRLGPPARTEPARTEVQVFEKVSDK